MQFRTRHPGIFWLLNCQKFGRGRMTWEGNVGGGSDREEEEDISDEWEVSSA